MRRRLLVLRNLGLGDFLTGIPSLRGLRRAFPEHELVLVAPEALRELAMLCGAVDACIQVVIIWSSAVLPAPPLAHAPMPRPRVSESPIHKVMPGTPLPPARIDFALATHAVCHASS